MIATFKAQYELVKQSRKILLDYCSEISLVHFLTDKSVFGRGSIRNLLVHIANTYEFWIGKQGLKREMVFTPFESVKTVEEAQSLFLDVDKLMTDFFEFVETNQLTHLELELDGKTEKTELLKLFTHVVTHEFHHKGQILSLSRSLGYTPIDTDVI